MDEWMVKKKKINKDKIKHYLINKKKGKRKLFNLNYMTYFYNNFYQFIIILINLKIIIY
jgi:hypothetical protein